MEQLHHVSIKCASSAHQVWLESYCSINTTVLRVGGRGCFRAFVYHECPTLPSALPPEVVEAVDAAISHTAARLCARLALDAATHLPCRVSKATHD